LTRDIFVDDNFKDSQENAEYRSLMRIAIVLEAALPIWRDQRDTFLEILDELQEIRTAIVGLSSTMPTGFTVVEKSLDQPKGEFKMTPSKATATVDLTTLDDGKGVLYTFTPVNSQGATVTLPAGTPPISGTSSDPAMTVAQDPGDPAATPPRPADTTGLVLLGSIAQPAKDVAGIVVTGSTTLPNGTVLSLACPPVDIVPDPNNPANPTGFTVVEANA
jgi:hypothetical protein